MTAIPQTALQLRSRVRTGGQLELSLVEAPVPACRPDDVLIRVEAAPINPSDLGLLLGPADIGTARASGSPGRPILTADIPERLMRGMAARLDQSLPTGNEGAGLVVAAGDSPEAQALLGRTVAVLGRAMYAQYFRARATDCLVLPPGVSAADGASAFVNPLTALGMVETMRMEGHTALVHTAAASNLGQMLNRICQAEGVALVNIVRRPEQAEILRDLGAVHIVDSSASDFMDRLIAALNETGATLAFDAIGGGKLTSQILTGMEAAATRSATAYNRYGSSTHKQVYIYGGLDTGPTELYRGFGFAWGVGGFLLTPFLERVGPKRAAELRQRVAAEIRTTFASRYTAEISLAEALQPEVAAAYNRKTTGEKYLINPNKGLS
jgi:NADPH:quinone reductase-like Zn-dependent oxidoreductase